jgi:arylsulfatase A-like enzyme
MSDKPAWMQALPPLDEAKLGALYNQRIASMRAVDDLLGQVVRALGRVGELDRTAFVFTSDNGYLLGAHRWEAKILFYEESIRVPLMLRVPGLSGPRSVDGIALNNDLAPTIAALAGAAPGVVMDGRSLLPLLDGTATGWRRRFLAEFPPQFAGPAADDADAGPPEVAAIVPPFFAVRSGTDDEELSQLVYGETMRGRTGVVAARELYDLDPRVDPFQLASRHRHPAYLARQRRLKQHLEALKACGNGTCQALEE